MKFHFLCFILALALDVEAFTLPSRQVTSNSPFGSKNEGPLLVRYSTAVATHKWKDLHEFNIELDGLAEKAGNFNQPVISRASECEELWNAQAQDSDAKIRPDTISFNTVLKAWNRCCSALSESSRNHKTLKTDMNHSVDVYTARDAAKRATTLLIHQEKEETNSPDTTSFNIVIGKPLCLA